MLLMDEMEDCLLGAKCMTARQTSVIAKYLRVNGFAERRPCGTAGRGTEEATEDGTGEATERRADRARYGANQRSGFGARQRCGDTACGACDSADRTTDFGGDILGFNLSAITARTVQSHSTTPEGKQADRARPVQEGDMCPRFSAIYIAVIAPTCRSANRSTSAYFCLFYPYAPFFDDQNGSKLSGAFAYPLG
ncbi:hypothetical protein [Pararobbsia alpina]|uniref:hypothetical protein n=1 Tax=Pararobbsia alpina TaxID=621374 RepID=UPI0039A48F36